jgi:purine catabolism regulator
VDVLVLGDRCEMALWLDTLLAEPSLRLALLTPSADVRARGPVQWAHISDLPDPTPWLEGGEVLLTTGLGIRRSEGLQREFVEKVAARGCVALGFSAEEDGNVLPTLVTEAERWGLPLFSIPHEVPLIAITKAVSRGVFEEQYSVLSEAVKMHRGVLRAILHGNGLSGVVRAGVQYTPGFTYYLYDYYGSLLVGPSAPVAGVDPISLFAHVAEAVRGSERSSSRLGALHAETAAVRLLGDVEAILVAVGVRPLSDQDVVFFEQTLTGVSLELARRLSFREERRARVRELLEDVWGGAAPLATTSQRLRRMGLDPQTGFQALCVRYPSSVTERMLATLVEDVVGGATGLVGVYDRRLYCVVQGPEPGIAEGVVTGVGVRCWRGVRVGRSAVRTGVDQLLTALQEARLAADAELPDTPVRDVASLGITGVIASLFASPGADTFIEQVLGPLLSHDELEGGHLVETVRKYLGNGCRPGPAARDLNVHRHTLAYRLERIRQMTGRDPRDGEDLMAFGLALKMLDQREGGEACGLGSDRVR